MLLSAAVLVLPACLAYIGIESANILSLARIFSPMEALTDSRGSIPFDQRSFSIGFLETSFADYYTMRPQGAVNAFIQVKPKGADSLYHILFFAAVLVFGMLLSSCGKQTIEALPMPQSVEGLRVGDNTYYIGLYPGVQGVESMLCCIPKGERMPIPVCGKSGCRHNDADCCAYCLSYSPEESCALSPSVGYFRDRLYTVSLLPERKIGVYSTDLQAAERRLELTIDPQEPLSALNVNALFHENRLLLLYT